MIDSPEHHQSRPRRRWVRALFIGVAVLVMLVAGLVAFLHTPPARRFVVSRITELLRQQNVQFETDDLSYNLLDLSVRFRNLRIRAHGAPELPPFAEIDEARLDLSLMQVLRGRYVLQDGSARGVRVHYYVDENGRDNLPRQPRDPDQPSQPLDYLIDQLAVRDARVRYENRAQRIDLSLPVSSMDIDGNTVTDRHNVRIEAARGAIAVEHRNARLDRLIGDVDLGDDDVKITNAELEIEGSRLTLTGAIAGFDAPQADLVARGTIDAGRASALAGLKEAVAGVVTIDASVKGPIAAPAVGGRVSGSQLSFRNIHSVDASTSATYDM